MSADLSDTSRKYRTILIDPPWPEHGAGKSKRGADKHYPLLKVREINQIIAQCPMFKPDSEGCHLYLWTTNNYLKGALDVMQNLGFRYITNLVWVKDHFGLGQYFRQQHELCLFGVKGETLMTKTKNVSTIIKERKRKHSEKPRSMYAVIEQQSYAPRLEMFAREKREGWDAWGLDVPRDMQTLLGSRDWKTQCFECGADICDPACSIKLCNTCCPSLECEKNANFTPTLIRSRQQ